VIDKSVHWDQQIWVKSILVLFYKLEETTILWQVDLKWNFNITLTIELVFIFARLPGYPPMHAITEQMLSLHYTRWNLDQWVLADAETVKQKTPLFWKI
jgi:hypothetical protein